MNTIILAGGNQTRFGKISREQSKILLPLTQNETILSNIVRQLNQTEIEKIIIALKDKNFIADYTKNLSSKKEIVIDDRDISGLGNYFFKSTNYLPATYIFGDTYFPNNSLTAYFSGLKGKIDLGVKAVIGVSRSHVGDFRVEVSDDYATKISRDGTNGYFTCGLFTFIDSGIVGELEPCDKLTDVFSQLLERNYKVGYILMEEGLIDLDTQDKARELMNLVG
jgi:NDP-sugar pyrophosphorylase family protein